jgi:hypothetical protein
VRGGAARGQIELVYRERANYDFKNSRKLKFAKAGLSWNILNEKKGSALLNGHGLCSPAPDKTTKYQMHRRRP